MCRRIACPCFARFRAFGFGVQRARSGGDRSVSQLRSGVGRHCERAAWHPGIGWRRASSAIIRSSASSSGRVRLPTVHGLYDRRHRAGGSRVVGRRFSPSGRKPPIRAVVLAFGLCSDSRAGRARARRQRQRLADTTPGHRCIGSQQQAKTGDAATPGVQRDRGPRGWSRVMPPSSPQHGQLVAKSPGLRISSRGGRRHLCRQVEVSRLPVA